MGAASAVLRPPALLGAGSEAPSFELGASDGSQVRSDDLKGDKHYVLVFYPGDNTPGCTLQLKQFSDLAEKFAAQDCLVFGVNAADQASHQGFCDAQGYQIPLLVDSDRSVAEAFQTARPGVPVTFRAVFFVDKKGIVRLAMKDYPDPEAVLRMVERNNETGYKGTGRKGRRIVPEVSGYGLSKLQENDTSTTVLDIRDPADWAAGHVPGSVNIPIDQLIARMDEVPSRDTPVVIACDQGLRANGAARILKDSGWRKLYTLIDGMESYKGQLES
jgi:thioredoxin-dependent peroxiredoxin